MFGIDSMAEAAHAAVRLGALRPLLVTDPGLIEAGWTDEMISHLRAYVVKDVDTTGLVRAIRAISAGESAPAVRRPWCAC